MASSYNNLLNILQFSPHREASLEEDSELFPWAVTGSPNFHTFENTEVQKTEPRQKREEKKEHTCISVAQQNKAAASQMTGFGLS